MVQIFLALGLALASGWFFLSNPTLVFVMLLVIVGLFFPLDLLLGGFIFSQMLLPRDFRLSLYSHTAVNIFGIWIQLIDFVSWGMLVLVSFRITGSVISDRMQINKLRVPWSIKIFIMIQLIVVAIGIFNYGLKGALNEFRPLLTFFWVFPLFALVQRDRIWAKRFFRAIIYATIFKCVITLVLFFGSSQLVDRLTEGTMWERSGRFFLNSFEGSIILLPVMLAGYLWGTNIGISPGISFLCVCLMMFDQMISQSRMGILGFFWGVITVCFITQKAKGLIVPQILYGAIIFTLFMGSIIGGTLCARADWRQRLSDRMGTFQSISTDASWTYRNKMIGIYISEGFKSPIIGQGYGKKFYPLGGQTRELRRQPIGFIDNLFVTSFVLGGVVGLLGLIFLIVEFYTQLRSARAIVQSQKHKAVLDVVMLSSIWYFISATFMSCHLTYNNIEIIFYICMLLYFKSYVKANPNI